MKVERGPETEKAFENKNMLKLELILLQIKLCHVISIMLIFRLYSADCYSPYIIQSKLPENEFISPDSLPIGYLEDHPS